uniref:GC vitamin D binding protein n=1 Tax=Electrophorus electricus TaxID=8005 RepID=A0A4W4E322_ELEEL
MEKITARLQVRIDRFVVLAIYSQKFPNGTFEEVSSVVNEFAKLAEDCCQNEADPDCFDKEKPCKKDSPLHSNQGIEQCCAREVEERTPCLLKVHYSEDQLPSLLELSHEEICAQYEHDPSDYTLRYVHEFARRHRSVPAGLLLNVTLNLVRMAKNCCSPKISTSCFLQEKYQQRSLTTFLRFLTYVCYNNVYLKFHKTGLASYYGSLLQVQFEEASKIAQHFQSALTKFCFQTRPKYIIEEFTSFQKVLCKESILSSMPEEFKICCSKAPLDTLTCVDNLKIRPQASGNMTQVIGTHMIVSRHLFQIGVKHASVPLPVLTTIQDQMRSTVEACCSDTNDTKACLEEKKNKLEKTEALLTKIDGFCSQYFKTELPAFKTMVEREVQGEGAEKRARAWVELATSCCLQHSPALACQKLTEAIIKSEDDATS